MNRRELASSSAANRAGSLKTAPSLSPVGPAFQDLTLKEHPKTAPSREGVGRGPGTPGATMRP